MKYSFDRVLDQTKKSPQYGNIRAIKEVEGRRRGDRAHHHRQAVPAAARAARLLPDREQEARRDGGRPGLRHDVAGRHRPLEVRGVEAGPAHPPGGVRPALARQAPVQAPGLPRHPRDRHPGAPRSRPAASTSSATSPPTSIPELKTHPQTYISSTPILRVHYVDLDMRVGALRQEGGAPGRELRDRQAADHPEADGAASAPQVATVVQPLAFGFDPEVKPYPFDQKKAKELLAQAGLPERRRHHAAQLVGRVPPGRSRPSPRC